MPKLVHADLGIVAEMILTAHESPSGDFRGFVIEGRPRIGKTVYTIKTLRDVYMRLHPEATIEDAYEWAIQNVHFKLEPFLELVGNRQKAVLAALPRIDWTQRIPGVVLDDSSLYAGTDLYFRDLSLYSSFSDTMTTIGTATSGILITCPKYQALAKPIREFYNYYVVKITKGEGGVHDWRREAKVMEWYEHGRSRALKLREVGTDEFSCRMPQEIYSKYLKPRLEMGGQAVDEALAASRARASVVPMPTEIRVAAEGVLGQTPLPKKGRRHRKIPLYRPPEPSPQPRRPLSELKKELRIES